MAEEDQVTSASPLSGAYLLIVLGEPNSEQHKQILLQRLAKGLSSWDSLNTQIDIESELKNIAAQCPNGEDVRNGEKLIQLASDSLVTEILIHPQVSTLKQCMRNLMASFTRHRHVVHAGYTLSGTGAWVLQDGLFEFADLVDIWREPEVQRLCKAYDSSITMDLHCAEEGPWNADSLRQESAIKSFKVDINPAERLGESSALAAFTQYISDTLPSVTIEHLLEPTDVVGNIRFSHPTLYVFPGGQGDSALFGISGFNILVDGGFGRKPCFWDFARHLDRLDAVVMTRNTPSTLSGLSSVVCRKAASPIYPQVGHVFCNLPEPADSETGQASEPLTVHLPDMSRAMHGALGSLQLKAQPLYRSNHAEPINLYHKVGHGTLDMYVISPSADSAEVKELARLWRSGGGAAASAFKTVKMGAKELRLPLLDLVSVCALLVWQPADPSEPVTRLLFPGSAPQHKILEGLEKLRHLDFLRAPVCTAKNMIQPAAVQQQPKQSSPKSKSMSSPRHTAGPAPEPPALKAPVRKEKPQKEANNKEADNASTKSTTARPLVKAKTESGSKTGSVELRPKKTETKATPMAKPMKKDPVIGDQKTPPVQKIKKDAANMKVAESRVLKSTAAPKRVAVEEQKVKKADDSIKESAPKPTRAQSLAREKRSASSTRAPEDDKKPKLVKKIAATKEGTAEAPAKAAKPLAKAKTGAPKAAPLPATKEVVKKEKPKAAPKPPTKSAAPPKPSKEPATKDPAAKAVKRPVKKPIVIATSAAAGAAVAAVVAAVEPTETTTSEEQPAVEETFTATEVAPAASAPNETQEVAADDAGARDAVDILAAIEDQIVSETTEDEPGAVEQVDDEIAAVEEVAATEDIEEVAVIEDVEEVAATEDVEEVAAIEDGDETGEQEEAEPVTEEQAEDDEEDADKAEETDEAVAVTEEADVSAEDVDVEEEEEVVGDQEADNEVEPEPETVEAEQVASAEAADDVTPVDDDDGAEEGDAIEKAETEEVEEVDEPEIEAAEAHAEQQSEPTSQSPDEADDALDDAEPVDAPGAETASDEAIRTEDAAQSAEPEAEQSEEPADREMAVVGDVSPDESASDPASPDQMRRHDAANEREEDADHVVEQQDEASNIAVEQDAEASIGQEQIDDAEPEAAAEEAPGVESIDAAEVSSKSLPDEKSSAPTEMQSDDESPLANQAAEPEAEAAELGAESIAERREAKEEQAVGGGERKASTGGVSDGDAARIDGACLDRKEDVDDDRDVELDRSIGSSIVETERPHYEDSSDKADSKSSIGQEPSPIELAEREHDESETTEEEEIRKEEADVSFAKPPQQPQPDGGADEAVVEQEFVAVKVVRKVPCLPEPEETESIPETLSAALPPVVAAKPVKPAKTTQVVTPAAQEAEDNDDEEVVEVFHKESRKPRDFAVPITPSDEETASLVAALQLQEDEEKAEKEEKKADDAHGVQDSSKDAESADPADEVDACREAHPTSKFAETISSDPDVKEVKEDGSRKEDNVSNKADQSQQKEEKHDKIDEKHVEAVAPSEPENQKRDSEREELASQRDSRLSTGSANTQQSDIECDEEVVEEVFQSKVTKHVEAEKTVKYSESSSIDDALEKYEQPDTDESAVGDSLQSELDEVIETVTSKIEETFDAAKKLLDHKPVEEEIPARDDIRDSNKDRVEDVHAFELDIETPEVKSCDDQAQDVEELPVALDHAPKEPQVHKIQQQFKEDTAVAEEIVKEETSLNDKTENVELLKSSVANETSHVDESDIADQQNTVESAIHDRTAEIHDKPEPTSDKAQDYACDHHSSASDAHQESTQEDLSLPTEETEDSASPIPSLRDEPTQPQVCQEQEAAQKLSPDHSPQVQQSVNEEAQDTTIDKIEETTSEEITAKSNELGDNILDKAKEHVEDIQKSTQELAKEISTAISPEASSALTTADSSEEQVESPKEDTKKDEQSDDSDGEEVQEPKCIKQIVQDLYDKDLHEPKNETTVESKETINDQDQPKNKEVNEQITKTQVVGESHEQLIPEEPKKQEIVEKLAKKEINEEQEKQDIPEKSDKKEVPEEHTKQEAGAQPMQTICCEKFKTKEVSEDIKNEEITKLDATTFEHKIEQLEEEPKKEEIREESRKEEVIAILESKEFKEEPKAQPQEPIKEALRDEHKEHDVIVELKNGEQPEETHKELKEEILEEPLKHEMTELTTQKVNKDSKGEEILEQPKKSEVHEDTEKQEIKTEHVTEVHEESVQQEITEEIESVKIHEETTIYEVALEPKTQVNEESKKQELPIESKPQEIYEESKTQEVTMEHKTDEVHEQAPKKEIEAESKNQEVHEEARKQEVTVDQKTQEIHEEDIKAEYPSEPKSQEVREEVNKLEVCVEPDSQEIHEEVLKQETVIELKSQEVRLESLSRETHEEVKKQEATVEPESLEVHEEPTKQEVAVESKSLELKQERGIIEKEVREDRKNDDTTSVPKNEEIREEQKEQEVKEDTKREEILEVSKKQDLKEESKKEEITEEIKQQEKEESKKEEILEKPKNEEIHESQKKEVKEEAKKEESYEELKKQQVQEEHKKEEVHAELQEVQEEAKKQEITIEHQEIHQESEKQESPEHCDKEEVCEIFEVKESVQELLTKETEKPQKIEDKVTLISSVSEVPRKQVVEDLPKSPQPVDVIIGKSEVRETLQAEKVEVPKSPAVVEEAISPRSEQITDAHSGQCDEPREKEQVCNLESPPKSPAHISSETDKTLQEAIAHHEQVVDHSVKTDAHSELKAAEHSEVISVNKVEITEPKSPHEPLKVETSFEPTAREEPRKKSIGDVIYEPEIVSTYSLATESHRSEEEQSITAKTPDQSCPHLHKDLPVSDVVEETSLRESTPDQALDEEHSIQNDQLMLTDSKDNSKRNVPLTEPVTQADVHSDKSHKEEAVVKPLSPLEAVEETFLRAEVKVSESIKEKEPETERMEKAEETIVISQTTKLEEHIGVTTEKVVMADEKTRDVLPIEVKKEELSATPAALVESVEVKELLVKDETNVEVVSSPSKRSPSPLSPLQKSLNESVTEVKSENFYEIGVEILPDEHASEAAQYDDKLPTPTIARCTLFYPPDTVSSPIDGPDDSKVVIFPGVSAHSEVDSVKDTDVEENDSVYEERIPSPITMETLERVSKQPSPMDSHDEPAVSVKELAKDLLIDPLRLSTAAVVANVELSPSPSTVESFVSLVKSQVEEVVEAAKEITESVVKTVSQVPEQLAVKLEENVETKEAAVEPQHDKAAVPPVQSDPLANLPVMEVASVGITEKSPTEVLKNEFKDMKEQLKVETLDVAHSSAGSSASATPKSPLSPNVPPASASAVPLPPAMFEDDARSASSLSSSDVKEREQDLAAMQKPDFRVGQEVEVASLSSKLSTIASSEAGADLSQPFSIDSNVSSATYDKFMASDRHLPEESAFSSGPASWDEHAAIQKAASYQGMFASDASATSSLASHTIEDNHPVRQLDQPSIEYEKTEPLTVEAPTKDSYVAAICPAPVSPALVSPAAVSPVPSSPFSTDHSASHGDFDASKDSLSSIQTSGSSDYHLGREIKVDDSASSARSDYSASSLDQPHQEDRSVTPRSDISSASESTMRPIIQPATEHKSEVKAAKVEMADPKVAPHNLWIKEKEAASPNPFSDQFPDDDAEHSEPLVLDVHRGTSELYYQQHIQQQLHSDIESDSQSSIPVAEFTDEYYAQHAMYMEATRPVGQPYDPEAESYSYESDDHDPRLEAKYSDSYDEADQYQREEERAIVHGLGDHQNGNSYHYYEPTESHSPAHRDTEIYEDMNRNGHSPIRDSSHQATASAVVTESAVLTTRTDATSVTTVSQTTVAPVSSQAQQQTQDPHEATLASWGKPLGLPAPVAPVVISSNGNGLVDTKKTPTANGSPLKRAATTNGNKASEKATNGSSNSASAPFYVDLAYIPHHCDPQYADVEFFRRVRARHYVLSSLEPSAVVLDALLEGKQSWTGDDKELDVTIIPTYDSDALATWVSANEDLLARNRIDLAPSASRCTINLQDHETSCSAYRLEF